MFPSHFFPFPSQSLIISAISVVLSFTFPSHIAFLFLSFLSFPLSYFPIFSHISQQFPHIPLTFPYFLIFFSRISVLVSFPHISLLCRLYFPHIPPIFFATSLQFYLPAPLSFLYLRPPHSLTPLLLIPHNGSAHTANPPAPRAEAA